MGNFTYVLIKSITWILKSISNGSDSYSCHRFKVGFTESFVHSDVAEMVVL